MEVTAQPRGTQAPRQRLPLLATGVPGSEGVTDAAAVCLLACPPTLLHVCRCATHACNTCTHHTQCHVCVKEHIYAVNTCARQHAPSVGTQIYTCAHPRTHTIHMHAFTQGPLETHRQAPMLSGSPRSTSVSLWVRGHLRRPDSFNLLPDTLGPVILLSRLFCSLHLAPSGMTSPIGLHSSLALCLLPLGDLIWVCQYPQS